MLEAVGHDAQGERLDFRDRLVLARPVGKDARQLDHLGDPATVGLLLKLDTKGD